MTDTITSSTGNRKHLTGRLLLGGLIIALFVVGYRFFARPDTAVSQQPRQPGAVTAQDFIVDGTLETDEVDVASKLPGRLAKVLVDEGDRVTAGQVVAVLEAEELDAKHDQGVAGMRAAEVQMAQGRIAEELEARKSDGQARQAQAGVDAAVATLGMAQAKLAALREGVRPQELANAAAAVKGAE
ncbi:MAG TPA: biotin/lipoyl-binding protein, partial [Armatimonadota bacterium]